MGTLLSERLPWLSVKNGDETAVSRGDETAVSRGDETAMIGLTDFPEIKKNRNKFWAL
jgi:hypothetical protein